MKMKKRTRFLLLLMVTLLIVAATLALVSCNNKTSDTTDTDDDTNNEQVVNKMTFTDYMRKINGGRVSSGSYIDSLADYHVSSEYTFYTSTENYTLTYEAVYR